MQFRCDLDPDLAEHWRPAITRQCALTLDPLRARLKTVRVRLVEEGGNSGSAWPVGAYRCELIARGQHGESWRAVARHRE